MCLCVFQKLLLVGIIEFGGEQKLRPNERESHNYRFFFLLRILASKEASLGPLNRGFFFVLAGPHFAHFIWTATASDPQFRLGSCANRIVQMKMNGSLPTLAGQTPPSSSRNILVRRILRVGHFHLPSLWRLSFKHQFNKIIIEHTHFLFTLSVFRVSIAVRQPIESKT